MTQDEYLKAKQANDRVAMILVVLFFVWLPIYLIIVRPKMNAWLFQYIRAYPAIFHLIPIFAPSFLLGWLLTKKYPAPQPPKQ